ncbi:MAG: radical SAM family heme chaperone HemW [candidate division Zixibacteria bacterium]|nr:radical SAM family heme chaperone HemW [candidate division Zixibacteria bacterium]
MAAGIYVHIPFCLSRCNYCDFYSITADDFIINEFYEALLTQIELVSQRKWGKRIYNTIYLGGGTPPLIGDEKIGEIIWHLRKCFNFTPNTEITIEANPESVSPDLLKNLHDFGINRITLGVQSFNDNLLKTLGRPHNSETADKAIDMIYNAGFENIGIDLIFGIPGQTIAVWRDTLKKAINKQPPHISAYELTIENETPIERMINSGELTLLDDDLIAEMYQILHEMLTESGYKRYEVTNYAKPGFECRHNLKYWTDRKYLGLGPSAHSYYTKYRTSSYKSVDKYVAALNKGKLPTVFKEELSDEQKSQERLMLGLRLASGIDIMTVREAIDKEKMAEFIQQGYLKKSINTIALTDRGFMIADEIIVKLLKR